MPPIAYRGFAVAPITLRPLSTILARPPHSSPKTSLFEGGGPPAGGGRSSRASRPIPLRTSFRSPLYTPGCRVATLLVSMGVMGFLGDLRGRNSKSPPNPLGLSGARPRTPPQRPPSSREGDRRRRWKEFPRPSPVEKFPFSTPPGSPVGQVLRPCRRLHIGALLSPLSPFAPSLKSLIQPRVQGRNPARFNGGYGVPRGFKGEKSKSPPNPLGLRSTSPRTSPQRPPFLREGGPPAGGGRSSSPVPGWKSSLSQPHRVHPSVKPSGLAADCI